MTDIIEILSTFDAADLRSFHHFLNRQKQVSNRKSIEMLEILINNPTIKPARVAEKLYKKPNNEAYQAVRKNLKKQLTNFIVLKNFEEGSDTQQTVLGLISLSRYLFDHAKGARAWKFLLKAEGLACEYELYNYLDLIYMLQIEYINEHKQTDINDLLNKFETNKQKADRDRKISIALSIVKFKLQQVRISGRLIDFDNVLQQVIADYQLQEDYLSQAKLFYQFMEIFRSAVIANKDYYSFEPFILSNYRKFLERSTSTIKDNFYKAGILYMIAHTLYRNKKFLTALLYLEQLNKCFETGNKATKTKYFIRCTHMIAHCQYFTGGYQQAINLLENTLKNNPNLENYERLNLLLSLSFYFFFQEETSKANRLLFAINTHENTLIRWMGSEWALKKDLLELIVQYELGNFEWVQNRKLYIEKAYNSFLSQNPYIRIVTFLNLINETIDKPGIIYHTTFYEKVDASFQWLPVEQEDTQAVLFYVWFKARMLKQPLYRSLVEMMAQAPADVLMC